MTHAPLSSPTPSRKPQRTLRLLPDKPERAGFAKLVDDGLLAERQGRRDEARRLYEAALRRLDDAPNGREAAAVLRWIARTYQVDANPEAALDCIEASLAVAEAHGDIAAIGHATNLEAIVRWQQGELDQAERLLLRARESALSSHEAKLAAMTSQNLGVIANIRGDLETALRHYRTALADYRALGLAGDVCIALNNLGILYTVRQQWDDAVRSYEEALGIADVLGDLSTRIMLEVNFAECWVAQGQLDRARAVCDRAMETSQEAQDPRAHGELYKMYGVIARETGDMALAEQCLGRAREIAEQRQDQLLLAECAKETAELCRLQNRNRESLQQLNRAHRVFSQLRAGRELADIDRRMGELEREFLDVVRRWGESIESKDHYTQGHCERVADIACALAAKAGMDEQSLFWFRIGALLHDVGKLVIPSEVLNKPKQLTPAEWELVKQHPVAGVQMLAEIDFPWDVRPMVESHHERWDGQGYPHGLKGEAIPHTARILCVADVYDALTSERSYRRPLSKIEALDVMRADVGTQFDPALFPLFEEVVNELTARPALPPVKTRALVAPTSAATQLDELTGLPLRRAFVDRAARALREIERNDVVSLLVIDVDNFKSINDNFGHLEGDGVLRAVALALESGVSAPNFLARYAGDEFVVLLPGVDSADACGIAERLRTSVAAVTLSVRGRDWSDGPLSTTLSIGVATAPEQGDNVETLFAAADAALYEAKRQGRNVVVRANESGERVAKPTLHFERFAGRQAERRVLLERFDASVRGTPSVAAIVGEAGVGKTALVRELNPEVRIRGGSLVVGRCIDSEVRAPYAPWASLLDAIRVLRVVPDRAWRELPRLLPKIGLAPSRGREGSRIALFEEVAEYLRLAAAARPLVILLDDMQWADGPSWDLLEHVASRFERERLFICITIRDEDAAHDFATRRSRLTRDSRFHELKLARLTRDELRQWLERALAQESSAEFLAFLYRHTEGNPIFTVQVLRAMVEEGSLWWNGQRWEWRPVSELRLPVAVNDLLARRLARLSPIARRTLAAAAVIDRAIDVDLCVAAEIATEDELLDAIDEGLAASVLEAERPRTDDRVFFTHALLLDVLLESVNPRRLRRIHERAAVALERTLPGAAAQIAVHYDAAGIGDRAFTHALVAADAATAVYAHDEATAYLQIALRHAALPADLARVRMRLADVAESAGRYEESEELCSLALDWFRRQEGAADIVRCRRMMLRLQVLRGQPPHITCDECESLLAEATTEGLEAERIAILSMISQAQSRAGNGGAAVKLARECVELAERYAESRPLADALTRLGSALLQTNAAEAAGLFRRAHALFATRDDLLGQIRCEINLGVASSRVGDTQAAEDAYERALSRGRSAHSPDLAGLAALNLGVITLKRGRYDAARARIEEALRLFTRVHNEPHRLAARYNLAHLAREEGRLEDAATQYSEVAEDAQLLGITEVALGALGGAGIVAVARGDGETARVHRAQVEEIVRTREDWWFPGRELVEALRIELDIAAGARDVARRRFRHALALAEAHDIYGAMWLTRQSVPALADAPGALPDGEIESIVRRYAPRAEALGFAPITARFATLAPRAFRHSGGELRIARALQSLDAG